MNARRFDCVSLRRSLRRFGRTFLPLAACVCAFVPVADAEKDGDRAYFDQLFAEIMQEHEVPGMAAVLVKDGQRAFSAGYGFADVRQKTPVRPDRTIFPLGSISKLLTTVAVLQLAERGSLDLADDVRTHIAPFGYDQRFTAPITIHHLLTHTDGFDVRWLVGGAARVPEKVQPLPAMIAKLPPRLLPPGEVYLYSDVGMTLAGYIVERVSRQPFADYMDDHVLEPLGMSSSTFRSARPHYARDRATGYAHDNQGTLRPVPVVYPHAVPASGLTAPVSDLAPFMLALLQSESTGRAKILGETWVREMWRQQFAHHETMSGTAFGFYEFFHNGHRALVHGGLMPGFTTVLVLIPEARLGLCVAGNRFDLIGVFEDSMLRQLIDRYLPEAGTGHPTTPATRESNPRAAALEGTYRCDQYSRFSLDKLFVFAGLATDLEVRAEPDGRLVIDPLPGRWLHAGDNLYVNETSGERVSFRDDPHTGEPRLVGTAQFMSYHRLRPVDHLPTHYVVFAGLPILCLGATFVGWKHARRNRWLASRHCRWVAAQRRLLILTSLALLAFLGLFAASMARLDFFSAAVGEPRTLALIPYAAFVLALCAAAQTVPPLLAGRRWPALRVESAACFAAAAAILLLLPVLHYWRLLWLPFATA